MLVGSFLEFIGRFFNKTSGHPGFGQQKWTDSALIFRTCLTSVECLQDGGVALGSCAASFGVCCLCKYFHCNRSVVGGGDLRGQFFNKGLCTCSTPRLEPLGIYVFLGMKTRLKNLLQRPVFTAQPKTYLFSPLFCFKEFSVFTSMGEWMIEFDHWGKGKTP
jgi:hypothetical protein